MAETPKEIDPKAVRVFKRAVLILFGPFYFLFIAFVPLLCGRRKGFRGWYWRLVKRACSRLLGMWNSDDFFVCWISFSE